QAKIAAVADDVKIVETLPSLKTARKWLLQNAEPDLLFMDIQLSDGVSFELFEDFDLHCPVIFTTAYDEYALRAFKVNGIDYLLKPIDSEALAAAIQKYRRQAESQPKPPTNWQELLKTL
ncbi:MAG: response regulator, partial [Saprospiraceae bacterium]|nr:response regulator [Saprospiraceae bacterium]